MAKRIIITRKLPDEVIERAAAHFDVSLNADDHQYSPAELAGLPRRMPTAPSFA